MNKKLVKKNKIRLSDQYYEQSSLNDDIEFELITADLI